MNKEAMINAFSPGDAASLSGETLAMIERRQRVLGPMYRLFYRNPVRFERAEGVHMYDEKGTPYLDVYNNVPSVGHCPPHVVEAVSRQLARLNTHTRYLYDNVLTYAERLLATCPPELEHVMFTCSGSEATDLALRIARRKTSKRGIIVTDFAYHGNTAAATEVSPSNGPNIPIGIDVRTVPAPSAYHHGPEVGAKFARDVAAAIADLERHGIGFAALLVDTAFSSDGLCLTPAGFLAPAVEAVRAAGGVFIADEVQPGFGRLGEGMWGFGRHGLSPDLVVLGKPMGNGLPIGGIIARHDMVEQFGAASRYFNTFGGNPVCIAAALAVLDVLEDEKLIANAARVGAIMRAGLVAAQTRYPQIGDVRGAGLFIGVELVRDRSTKEPDSALALDLVNRLREKHVLISASSPRANVLKIRPPLCFSEANTDQFLATLGEVFAEATGGV